MKIWLAFNIVLVVFSCTPTKELIILRSQIHYQLVERAFVENNDTTYVNELQFDPVASATDFQSAMYNNFGKWDVKYDGKYNPNIAQIIIKIIVSHCFA